MQYEKMQKIYLAVQSLSGDHVLSKGMLIVFMYILQPISFQFQLLKFDSIFCGKEFWKHDIIPNLKEFMHLVRKKCSSPPHPIWLYFYFLFSFFFFLCFFLFFLFFFFFFFFFFLYQFFTVLQLLIPETELYCKNWKDLFIKITLIHQFVVQELTFWSIRLALNLWDTY